MTDRVKSQEQREADLAPETHNDEQDDEQSQAQEVASEAQTKGANHRPLESKKVNSPLNEGSEQDVIDEMLDMEQSGRIDMDAYRGEPNLDDNEGKYGESNKVDPDLPSDGG